MQVTGGGWQALDWSPDDSRLLVIEFTSITKSTLWLVDVASGQKTALTNPAEEVVVRRRRVLGRRPRRVCDHRQGQRVPAARLHRPGDEAAHAARHRSEWDVEGSTCRRTARRWPSSVNEAGVSKLYLLRHGGPPRCGRSPACRNGVLGALAWHRNNRELGFSMANARSTSDVYSLDADDRRGHPLDRERARRPGGIRTCRSRS